MNFYRTFSRFVSALVAMVKKLPAAPMVVAHGSLEQEEVGFVGGCFDINVPVR